MSSQVKKFSQCELRDKKHQHFSIVSLPTDSVIVDHAVLYKCELSNVKFTNSEAAANLDVYHKSQPTTYYVRNVYYNNSVLHH
jgi:hypothetical protein